MTAPLVRSPTRWVRSRDGYLAGVCEGLGRRFGIEPWLVRGAWLVSILAFGTGLLLYVIMALCLPREDELDEAYRKKLLGVCYRLSLSTGLEVGLVRALAVVLAFASLGATVVAYLVLYFVMPDEPRRLVA